MTADYYIYRVLRSRKDALIAYNFDYFRYVCFPFKIYINNNRNLLITSVLRVHESFSAFFFFVFVLFHVIYHKM